MSLIRTLSALLALSTGLFAHPGGGIIALSENSVLVADSVENFIWLLEKGREPKPLVSKFHGHWMTRGLDANIYVEAFQESGGAWSSAAFQLDLTAAKLTEIAHRRDLGALAFAVDRDGSLVFQRGASLVLRAKGKESPFKSSTKPETLGKITAYAWDSAGNLFVADRNRILRIDQAGATTLIAQIPGKVPEPRIWNATETPSIFGLAIDDTHRVLATVPDLSKVYRIDNDGNLHEFLRSEDTWRATGVATFGKSIFLMESDSRASTSPRVRIFRPNGAIETLTIPPRSTLK